MPSKICFKRKRGWSTQDFPTGHLPINAAACKLLQFWPIVWCRCLVFVFLDANDGTPPPWNQRRSCWCSRSRTCRVWPSIKYSGQRNSYRSSTTGWRAPRKPREAQSCCYENMARTYRSEPLFKITGSRVLPAEYHGKCWRQEYSPRGRLLWR